MKLLTIAGAAVVVIAMAVTAFAADRPSNPTGALRMSEARKAFTDGERPEFASGDGMKLKLRVPADMAQKLGIDTTGMTDEEIAEAVREAIKAAADVKQAEMIEKIKAALTENGMDVTGLTDDEVLKAAKEYKLQGLGREPRAGRSFDIKRTPADLAKTFGVDAEGMTNEQLADALADAVRAWCMEQFAAGQ